LKEKVEKRLSALNEQLEAAEAEAKAKKAKAEADAVDAELEQELYAKVNDLKEKLAEGQVYLQDLADAGEDKAEQLKASINRFFD
jgi:hypothetical protein